MLNTIGIINTNGGWRVTGWTKRGNINDIAFKETNTSTKLPSSKINHHFTTIVPDDNISTNATYLNAQWKMSIISE